MSFQIYLTTVNDGVLTITDGVINTSYGVLTPDQVIHAGPVVSQSQYRAHSAMRGGGFFDTLKSIASNPGVQALAKQGAMMAYNKYQSRSKSGSGYKHKRRRLMGSGYEGEASDDETDGVDL